MGKEKRVLVRMDKYYWDKELDKNREMVFVFCNMEVFYGFNKGKFIIKRRKYLFEIF